MAATIAATSRKLGFSVWPLKMRFTVLRGTPLALEICCRVRFCSDFMFFNVPTIDSCINLLHFPNLGKPKRAFLRFDGLQFWQPLLQFT